MKKGIISIGENMNKDEKKSLKKQLKREKKKEFINYKWVIKITLTAFCISFIFSALSETIVPNVNILGGIIILIIFILIGILFDMIGVSVTAAEIAPFNSMNSRKIKGADIAVKFIKNADKVSSFCNDVVGDICGIISGSAGSIIALTLAEKTSFDKFYLMLFITALIASLTIGGKALGKSFAINKSNTILYEFSKVVSYFYKK